MKLIDADIYSEIMKSYFKELVEQHKTEVDILECNAHLQELLDEQQIAYNPEKVVEQLEEYREEMKQFGADGILTDMLDIVRAGRKE